MMTAERNRRRQLTTKRLVKGIDRILVALQAQLAELEQDIDDAVRGSPAPRARRRTSSSPCQGSAQKIARTLIFAERCLNSDRSDQPSGGGAGRRRHPSTVRQRQVARPDALPAASAVVRSSPLYETVLVLIRRNSCRSRPSTAMLRAAGKPAKVAIVACMRKLATILNAILLRDKTPWPAPLRNRHNGSHFHDDGN